MTTPELWHTAPLVISQADFQALLRDKLCLAVRLMLNQVLDLEVEAFIGAAPYERTPTRQDYRNGSYERGLVTGVGSVTLTVPRTHRGFTSLVFERYCRRQVELNQAIGEMFVKGASTAQVGEIIVTLTGVKPSPSAVSRVHQTLQHEFDTWKQRPLLAQYLYVFADGTYFTVIYDNEGHKMPVLAVVDITPTGTREVLAFITGDRENEGAWTDLLTDLQRRVTYRASACGSRTAIKRCSMPWPPSFRPRPGSAACNTNWPTSWATFPRPNMIKWNRNLRRSSTRLAARKPTKPGLPSAKSMPRFTRRRSSA